MFLAREVGFEPTTFAFRVQRVTVPPLPNRFAAPPSGSRTQFTKDESNVSQAACIPGAPTTAGLYGGDGENRTHDTRLMRPLLNHSASSPCSVAYPLGIEPSFTVFQTGLVTRPSQRYIIFYLGDIHAVDDHPKGLLKF